MGLRLVERPRKELEELKTDLIRRARDNGFILASFRNAPPSSLAISTWHRVFEIRLTDIIDGRNIAECSEYQSWRCLIHGQDSEVIGMAEFAPVEQQVPGSVDFNAGPAVHEFTTAVGHAEAAPAAKEGDFELAVVESAALHISAIWLKPMSNEEHLFIPFGKIPKNSPVEKYSICNSQEVTKLVYDVAILTKSDGVTYA